MELVVAAEAETGQRVSDGPECLGLVRSKAITTGQARFSVPQKMDSTTLNI